MIITVTNIVVSLKKCETEGSCGGNRGRTWNWLLPDVSVK